MKRVASGLLVRYDWPVTATPTGATRSNAIVEATTGRTIEALRNLYWPPPEGVDATAIECALEITFELLRFCMKHACACGDVLVWFILRMDAIYR